MDQSAIQTQNKSTVPTMTSLPYIYIRQSKHITTTNGCMQTDQDKEIARQYWLACMICRLVIWEMG